MYSALVRVLREFLSPEFPLIDVYPIVSTSLFREACWHSPKALLLSQYERRMFEYTKSSSTCREHLHFFPSSFPCSAMPCKAQNSIPSCERPESVFSASLRLEFVFKSTRMIFSRQ